MIMVPHKEKHNSALRYRYRNEWFTGVANWGPRGAFDFCHSRTSVFHVESSRLGGTRSGRLVAGVPNRHSNGSRK